MDDLAHEIATIRDELTPEWTEARSERLFAGVGRLRRRRRTRRVTAVAASIVGAAAALMLALLPAAPSGNTAGLLAGADVPGAALRRVEAGQRAKLADGSTAELERGALAVVKNEPAAVVLRLESGRARFDVVRDPQRRFVVEAGAVEVMVVGTAFEVERVDARVRVAVAHGKVRVRSASGSAFVAAGEDVWFDEVERAALEPAKGSGAPHADESERLAFAREGKRAREPNRKRSAAAHSDEPAPASSWRSLSQSGDYESAYRLLASGTAVEDDPAALMDAADAARFSGHPQQSVSYFRRVLRDHRSSPVAPLAGFTLGRVLLEGLGQPSEAAEAFALARSLAPEGSLAQDALAREVEAWSKAGNTHLAYQRAQLYVRLYPAGRRLRAVQLYGGLAE